MVPLAWWVAWRCRRGACIETTSLHLDVLRDLRRIHSHICSVAYSALDAGGQLAVYHSLESEAAALSAPAPGGRNQLSRVLDPRPRFFTISMMLRI